MRSKSKNSNVNVKAKDSQKAQKHSSGHHSVSVRSKLIVYFACFAALILLIIWIFQIKMLSYFYRQTKLEELSHVSAEISSAIGDDDIQSRAVDLAMAYDTCIRVFRADSGHLGNELVSADIVPACLIHHLPSSMLSKIYQNAIAGGGEWSTQKKLNAGYDVSQDDATFVSSIKRGISAVSAKIVTVDGEDYIIILNTEFLPMNSTVRTLSVQFWWIAVAVLIAAVALSMFFSARISQPLTNMTRAAKKLAAGDYDTQFREEGYLETRELAETLNYAAGEIAKSDGLQRELIANVSHDLRTPLTMISGYAEVMRDIPGENSPENLQIIIDEAGRLSELVTDMLDISKLRAGAKTPEMSNFDLTETVREVMKRYEKLIGHEGYDISFSAGGEAVVYADRTMMLQVIYNLINNAVNYTGEDKKVSVIQTYGERDGRRTVRISVKDTGAGIPRDQIPVIWDRYYKIDKVHRRAAVGTGLGLSIVKGILRIHNAAYGVESGEGCGSVFWFELPLAKTEKNEED